MATKHNNERKEQVDPNFIVLCIFAIASIFITGCAVQIKEPSSDVYEQTQATIENMTGNNLTNVTEEPVPVVQEKMNFFERMLDKPVIKQVVSFLDLIVKDILGDSGWLWLAAICLIIAIIFIGKTVGIILLVFVLLFLVRHFMIK